MYIFYETMLNLKKLFSSLSLLEQYNMERVQIELRVLSVVVKATDFGFM